MFGKNKTHSAEEILGLIAALPDEEREKVQKAIEANVPAPEEGGGESPPPEETPTEEHDGAVEETPAEGPTNEEKPAPPEQNDGDGDDSPQAPASEEGTPETPENDPVQALAARVEALEQKLGELIEKQADAVKAEENADFGGYPDAPDAPAEDDERYNAVMRGYAGRNANKY